LVPDPNGEHRVAAFATFAVTAAHAAATTAQLGRTAAVEQDGVGRQTGEFDDLVGGAEHVLADHGVELRVGHHRPVRDTALVVEQAGLGEDVGRSAVTGCLVIGGRVIGG